MSCSKCEAAKKQRIVREQKKREIEEHIRQHKAEKAPPPTPPKNKSSVWSRFKFFVRGMIGMFGYATRISKRTSEDHVKVRQQICESCPIYDFGICNKDTGGCGCVLYAKIRVEKEKCPKGKWGPVEAKAK